MNEEVFGGLKLGFEASITNAPGMVGKRFWLSSYCITRREPPGVTAREVNSYTDLKVGLAAAQFGKVLAMATSLKPFQQTRLPFVVPSTEVTIVAPVSDLLILAMTRTHFHGRIGEAA